MVKSATNLGIKLASSPCFLAIPLMISCVIIKLLAALRQSVYPRTISNWPFPASECSCILKGGNIKWGSIVGHTVKYMSYLVLILGKRENCVEIVDDVHKEMIHVNHNSNRRIILLGKDYPWSTVN